MPSKAIFQSAGQISQHIIPGAYSRIDSVKSASGNVSANNGVIIGRGYGPKPLELHAYGNSADALNEIKGGELRDAVRLAFSPGMGLSPQLLYVMIVNSAVQSGITLKNGSAQDKVSIKSRLYGAFNNQIHLAVAAGTNRGKKVTVIYKDSSEVHDDIYRALMTIAYGTAACTLDIVNTSTVHTMISSAGGLSVALADFDTIGDLVGYINSLTGFTATAISGAELLSPLQLDQVSALDIKTGAQTLEASMYALIDELNQNSNLVGATDVSTTTGVGPVATAADTYLTGGSNGSYTASEWADALEALEAEDVQFIATPDSNASVHASIKTHCVSMSSTQTGKERQFLVGGAWGDAIATATGAAKTLNTALGLYAYVGGTQYDEYGNVAQYAASFISCMIMALKTCLAINMPLTAKNLNLIALEKKLKDSEIETLLMAGVCPLAYDSTGLAAIVRQFTTYQADDLKYNEFSMVQIMNYVSRDLRNYLKTRFIGNPGIKGIPSIIQGIAEGRLRTYVRDGLFAEDSAGNTFWNVLVRLSADKCYVDYNANITAPINFMFITQHFSEAI